MRYAVLLITLCLATSSLGAQEQKEESDDQIDYSKPTLLYIFREKPEPELTFTLPKPRLRMRFAFLPFMTGFSDFGTAAIPFAVDPFEATGTEFPYTASIFRKQNEEQRLRRELTRRVRAANRADNEE